VPFSWGSGTVHVQLRLAARRAPPRSTAAGVVAGVGAQLLLAASCDRRGRDHTPALNALARPIDCAAAGGASSPEFMATSAEASGLVSGLGLLAQALLDGAEAMNAPPSADAGAEKARKLGLALAAEAAVCVALGAAAEANARALVEWGGGDNRLLTRGILPLVRGARSTARAPDAAASASASASGGPTVLPLPAVAAGCLAVSRVAAHFGCVGAVVDSGCFDALVDLVTGKDVAHGLLANGHGHGLAHLPCAVQAAVGACLGACASWPSAAAELEGLGARQALAALAADPGAPPSALEAAAAAVTAIERYAPLHLHGK